MYFMRSEFNAPEQFHALLESVGVNALHLAVQVVEEVNEVLDGDLAVVSLELEAITELGCLLSDGLLA